MIFQGYLSSNLAVHFSRMFRPGLFDSSRLPMKSWEWMSSPSHVLRPPVRWSSAIPRRASTWQFVSYIGEMLYPKMSMRLLLRQSLTNRCNLLTGVLPVLRLVLYVLPGVKFSFQSVSQKVSIKFSNVLCISTSVGVLCTLLAV